MLFLLIFRKQPQEIFRSECTMLADHSTNLKHNFDFSNPKILDKEHNLEKRLILEMIEILNNKNSINKGQWIVFLMFIKNF